VRSMSELPKIERSVVVAASPEELYDMVADLTRMGEWSPACTGVTWDDGAGPSVGSWFTGHNKMGDRDYDTRCEITDAQRPTTIAWMQRGREEGFTEWRYAFLPVEGGTEVSETWTLIRDLPTQGGATTSPTEAEDRRKRMIELFSTGIEQTLAKLKSAAEG
jgi:uncharacterized protein YndB with AHSA1/START domain